MSIYFNFLKIKEINLIKIDQFRYQDCDSYIEIILLYIVY